MALTASAMAHCEEETARGVALAFFVSLIVSGGGDPDSPGATSLSGRRRGRGKPCDCWQIITRVRDRSGG